MMDFEPFPTVYWPAWNADASFIPGAELPEDSRGRLWAVLVFLFYGDKVVLADIGGRGLCIPSGKIEPAETIDRAAERESYEETGAHLRPDRRRLVGCYKLKTKSGDKAGQDRYCPVFIAEALGFEAIPEGSESRGVFFASIEDVADLYFFWDALMAAVFEYADEQHRLLFPFGLPLSDLISD